MELVPVRCVLLLPESCGQVGRGVWRVVVLCVLLACYYQPGGPPELLDGCPPQGPGRVQALYVAQHIAGAIWQLQ
jgi:hypothetical protein